MGSNIENNETQYDDANERLRFVIRQTGRTNKDIASMIGMSEAHFSRRLNEIPISPKFLKRVARAIGGQKLKVETMMSPEYKPPRINDIEEYKYDAQAFEDAKRNSKESLFRLRKFHENAIREIDNIINEF